MCRKKRWSLPPEAVREAIITLDVPQGARRGSPPARHHTAPPLGEPSCSATEDDGNAAASASDFADFAEGAVVAQGRIELPTPAFSVRCSTN